MGKVAQIVKESQKIEPYNIASGMLHWKMNGAAVDTENKRRQNSIDKVEWAGHIVRVASKTVT